MTPLFTVLAIIIAVALVGAIAAFVRDRARFAGYRDLMRDALALAKRLRGEAFRDGADLVVSGAYSISGREGKRTVPAVVRFSHAETTPGLNIHLGAPTTLKVAVFPRTGTRAYENRALVRTPDDNFNSRFECRTDQPTQARLLLESRSVMAALRELCRTSHDALTMGDAAVEYSQLGAPNVATVRGVEGRLRTLSAIVEELAAMPGADAVKVEAVRKPRRLLLRATIVAGVIAVAIALTMARDLERDEAPTQTAQQALPAGMDPAHAAVVPALAGYRMATEADMDASAVGWLRSRGGEPSGRIALDFTGSGEKSETAYLLISPEGQRRVVIVTADRLLYESRFDALALAARFPKPYVEESEWMGTRPLDPRGDGLLLVRAPDDTGVVIFQSQNGAIDTPAPKNFRDLRVRY